MGLSNDPNHEEEGIEVVERVPKEKIRVIKYCKNVALYDSIQKNIRPVVHSTSFIHDQEQLRCTLILVYKCTRVLRELKYIYLEKFSTGTGVLEYILLQFNW